MFQEKTLRNTVDTAIDRQQELIRTWGRPGPQDDESYRLRLESVLGSAFGLKSYREFVKNTTGGDPCDYNFGPGHWSETLRRLPLMSKDTYRLISEEAFQTRRSTLLHYFETSGTTDRPMPTPKGLHDLVVNTVNFGDHWGRFLHSLDVALILINTPQGPAAFQFEQALNYLGILTFRTWVDTVRNDYGRVVEIAGFLKPTVFAGPPSQLINLYEHCHNHRLQPPKFAKVLLTGERSSPSLKRRIRALTGGMVIDASYGSSETGTTAVAVSEEKLKLQTHSYIFELVDRSGQVGLVDQTRPQEGELVVTALENLHRPLVRYRTGDWVRIVPDQGDLTISPLGRIGKPIQVGGLSLGQDDFESLVWAEGKDSSIFNYFVADDGTHIHFVFTGAYSHVAEAEVDLGDLKGALPRVKLHLTTELPRIVGLGSTLGWKAARVHDLRPGAQDRLAGPIEKIRKEVREYIQALA